MAEVAPYTTMDVSRMLGVHFKRVMMMVAEGRLTCAFPGQKGRGHSSRFSDADLRRFLETTGNVIMPGHGRRGPMLIVGTDIEFREEIGINQSVLYANNTFDAGKIIYDAAPSCLVIDLAFGKQRAMLMARSLLVRPDRPYMVAMTYDDERDNLERTEHAFDATLMRPFQLNRLFHLYRISPHTPRRVKPSDAEVTARLQAFFAEPDPAPAFQESCSAAEA